MSNQVNTSLMERAAEMLDEWQGTVIAEVIEQDLGRDDLESLNAHVCKAEAMLAQEDFEANDVY